jgi:4a-hydroxytetrahydrobiopterin dehydratase
MIPYSERVRAKMTLSEKSCLPCKGDTEPLTNQACDAMLEGLDTRWTLNDAGHLAAIYEFSNFRKALEFAHKVGDIADAEGHHPDLTISWGKCGIEIWTHKINGLSESDFILAAKIDEMSLLGKA